MVVGSLEEAAQHIESLTAQVRGLRLEVRDLTQRMDTMQTPIWRRIVFWLDGWPWYNLNGEQRRRPWHRRR